MFRFKFFLTHWEWCQVKSVSWIRWQNYGWYFCFVVLLASILSFPGLSQTRIKHGRILHHKFHIIDYYFWGKIAKAFTNVFLCSGLPQWMFWNKEVLRKRAEFRGVLPGQWYPLCSFLPLLPLSLFFIGSHALFNGSHKLTHTLHVKHLLLLLLRFINTLINASHGTRRLLSMYIDIFLAVFNCCLVLLLFN